MLHYRQSIDPDAELSELFKDVFLFHWKEEGQHAILDELEWVRHDAGVTAEERDKAVDEFIELVAAVDGILQAQATADTRYFAATCGRAVARDEAPAIEAGFLEAYRWQYIHSGAQHPHFGKVLTSLITEARVSASRRRSPRCNDPARINPDHPSRGDPSCRTSEDRRTHRRQRHQCRRPVRADRERQARSCERQDQLARRHDVAGPGAEPRGNREFRDRRRRGAAPVLDRHRRALELGGSNSFANPQEHLIAALNACMTVGYVAQCAVRGITLESLAIETEGEIDLRGFLGIDPAVPHGLREPEATPFASRVTAPRSNSPKSTRR